MFEMMMVLMRQDRKAAEQARREDRAAEEARFQRWMETQRMEREGTRRESLEPRGGYEKIPKYRTMEKGADIVTFFVGFEAHTRWTFDNGTRC